MLESPVLAAPILRFDELDSTNAEARRRAEAGEAGPVWITASYQTAGRGRRGRTWETGVGNLAATLLISTTKSPADAAQIAFVTALAVSDLVLTQVPAGLVSLKWPNDVLVDGAKVSGVLIESGPRDAGAWLAVGIGVNLATPPVVTERPATSLADHLRLDITEVMTPDAALSVLAEAFARRLSVWETYGFQPVRDAWTARAHGLGQTCTVRLDHETFDGVALGLEDDGSLRLRLADGALRRVSAGDVFFGGG